MDQEQREERNKETYGMLKPCLERAMALQTALILFEWDNETLAPEEAGKYTARVQGACQRLIRRS